MKDDACPTCGSKNFEDTEVSESIETKQCHNCKKFWFE